MNTLDCLKTRRSIRKYKNDKIPESDLKEIIDCGRLAPSANNKQPWEFILIQQEEKLKELSKVCSHGDFIQETSACIIVAGHPENEHILEDGSAASENILIAANALGYGGCWVAGWNQSYSNKVLEIVEAKELKLISVIPIGITEENPSPKKRDLNDVLHKENYEK